MDDKLIDILEGQLRREQPLTGVALRCPASPPRAAALTVVLGRQTGGGSRMEWFGLGSLSLSRRLFEMAVVTLLLAALGAASFNLLSDHGELATRAMAEEGGFVLLCPAHSAPGNSTQPTADKKLARTASDWARQTNIRRRNAGQSELAVQVSAVIDELGYPATQFLLTGGQQEDAVDLARQLQAAGAQPALNVTAVAPGNGDALTAVKPLDDPSNPYRGQYTDLDRWIFAHAWSLEELQAFRVRCQSARDAKHRGASATSDTRYMGALVTEMGWMMPTAVQRAAASPDPPEVARMTLFDRDNYERRAALLSLAASSHNGGRAAQGSWIFCGAGSDDIYQDFELSSQFALLSETPCIPKWLAANPPSMAVLVPNGDVVTYGALGEKHETVVDEVTHSATFPTYSGWYRYNAEGKTLDKNTAWGSTPQNWVKFYWPQAETVTSDVSAMDAYDPGRRAGSYWVKLSPAKPDATGHNDHAARTPVAAFAYDGKPLDLQSPVPAELLTRRILMDWEIPLAYEAQQRQQIWFGKGDHKP